MAHVTKDHLLKILSYLKKVDTKSLKIMVKHPRESRYCRIQINNATNVLKK